MTNITNLLLSDTLECNNSPILSYKINYPFFTSSCNPAAVAYLNDYYCVNAHSFENYLRKNLFEQAAENYRQLNGSTPVMAYEAVQSITITYHSDCIVSLYYDRYLFTGGAHGTTTRYSDTWNLENGHRIEVGEFFKSSDFKKNVMNSIIAAIADYKKRYPDSTIYFPEYMENVKASFRKNQFYLTPEGIIFYFQEYDIAPYSSHIPQFLFPFPS